jgi:hypothetical protein
MFHANGEHWSLCGVGGRCLLCEFVGSEHNDLSIHCADTHGVQTIDFFQVTTPMHIYCATCRTWVSPLEWLAHVGSEVHQYRVSFRIAGHFVTIYQSNKLLTLKQMKQIMLALHKPSAFVPQEREKVTKRLGRRKITKIPKEAKNDFQSENFVSMFKSGSDLESKCRLCPKVYGSRSSLQAHYRFTHHVPTTTLNAIRESLEALNEAQSQCEFCKWTFVDLPTHCVEYHHFKKRITREALIKAARNLSCLVCGDSYESASQLRTHFERVHFVDETVNNQIFLVSNGVPDQISCSGDSSDEEIEVECDICGYRADDLPKHMKKYHCIGRSTSKSFWSRFRKPSDFDTVCKFCLRASAFISHEDLVQHFHTKHQIPQTIIEKIRKKVGLKESRLQRCTLCRTNADVYDLDLHFTEFHLLKEKTNYTDLFNSDLECKSCILLFVDEDEYFEHLMKDHFIAKALIQSAQATIKKMTPSKPKTILSIGKSDTTHRFLLRERAKVSIQPDNPLIKEDSTQLINATAETEMNIPTIQSENELLSTFFDIDQFANGIPSNIAMPLTTAEHAVASTPLLEGNEPRDWKIAIDQPTLPEELMMFKEFIDLGSDGEDDVSVVTVSDVDTDPELNLEQAIHGDKDYFVVRTNLGLAKFPRKRTIVPQESAS